MTLKAFSLDGFRDLLAKGEKPDAESVIRMPVTSTAKAEGGDSKLVTFTITTDAPDRDRDVISVDGWDLKAYKKNPVVLWAHDYRQLPVARAKSIKVDGNKISAVADFTESAALDEFAAKVHAFVRAGLLNATSVGFRPLKYAYNEQRGGVDFEAAELLEFSVVPVPANAQALVEQRAAGMDTALIDAWAEEWLKTSLGEGVWTPKKTISVPPPKAVSVAEAGAEVVIPLDEYLKRLEALEERVTVHIVNNAKAAKGKPECPHGASCANSANAEQCPHEQCPMQEHARASVDPKVLPLKGNDDEIVVEIVDDEDASLDPAAVQRAVETVLETVIEREVRAAMTALTGRVD